MSCSGLSPFGQQGDAEVCDPRLFGSSCVGDLVSFLSTSMSATLWVLEPLRDRHPKSMLALYINIAMRADSFIPSEFPKSLHRDEVSYTHG